MYAMRTYFLLCTKLPLRQFLSGGAGVGKSTVTNALYEALIRYLNTQPENNPDDARASVVKVAPTGKAAFNIRRNTLHSAFKIQQTEVSIIAHLIVTD
jgi:adenylylsulfate kinase-like enzyme